MKKISLVYASATGNTAEMAKALEEGIISAGGKVEVSKIESINKEEVLSSDLIIMGSPAMGSEDIYSSFKQFMNEVGDKLSGKDIFLFGSYSWGVGKFMEVWQRNLEDLGAKIVGMPILSVEDPSELILEQLRETGKKLV